MKMKKLVILMLVFVFGIGAVSAQEDTPIERDRILREILQWVATETGLEPRAIVEQLGDGMTLAEIIESSGGDVDTIIDVLIANLTERINTAVAEGRITQERADRLLANLEDAVTRAVHGEYHRLQADNSFQEFVQGRLRRGVLRLAAQQTGLSVPEIRQQLQNGVSLAEVLTTNGVEVSAFIDAVSTRVDQRLDRLVENGRMTEERAAELLEQFRDRLEEQMNIARPIGV